MKIISILFLLVFIPLSSSSAVYRWTDNDGNTHYGERPPNRNEATHIQVPRSPKNNAEPAKKLKSLRQEILQQTQDSKKIKSEKKKEEAERKRLLEECKALRETLVQYTNNPRISEKGEDGEYTILSQEQRQNQIRKINNKINDLCS